jgi:hypothetical protein
MKSQRPASELGNVSDHEPTQLSGPLVTEGISKAADERHDVISPSDGVLRDGKPGEDSDPSQFPEFVHEYLREYIALADQKAGFVFAAISVVLGYLVNNEAFTPLKAFVSKGTLPGFASIVLFLATAALVISVILSISVVAPRLGRKTLGRKGIIFWKEISAFPTGHSYSAAVERLGRSETAAHIRAHCHALANICDKKYNRLAAAIWIGAGGFLLAVLSFAL